MELAQTKKKIKMDNNKKLREEAAEKGKYTKELLPYPNFQNMTRNPDAAEFYDSVIHRYDVHSLHPLCKKCVRLCKQTDCPGLTRFECVNFLDIG